MSKKKTADVRWINVFGARDCDIEENELESCTGGDSAYELLVIDGEVVEAGDYYHDHIGDKITGYLRCFTQTNKIKFTGESVVVPEEQTWGGQDIPEEKDVLFREVWSTKWEG